MAGGREKPRVVVAMSGGVDSSVAAALLVEQGYDAIGMMLRLWSEPGTETFNRCCTPEAMGLARRVAARLEMPFYVMDVRERFEQEIVQFFIDGYTQGITPNPCVNCNRQIRFGALLDQARSLGADFLATGHYARLHRIGGRTELHRGADPDKDQSYVLSALNQAQLDAALFPVGEYTKAEVRALAERFELPTAQRSESQDLCFLAGGDYRDFLLRHAPQVETPGEISDTAGNVIGAHRGLAFYTIGQRKGLGIAAPEPHYVVEKQAGSNRLIVGPQSALGKNTLLAGEANWLDPQPPDPGYRVEVQTRYTARAQPGAVFPVDAETFRVVFDEPQRDITPGQAAVVYDGNRAVASGLIRAAYQESG